MNKVCLKCIILDLCRQYIITQSRAHVKMNTPILRSQSHNEKKCKEWWKIQYFRWKSWKISIDRIDRDRPETTGSTIWVPNVKINFRKKSRQIKKSGFKILMIPDVVWGLKKTCIKASQYCLFRMWSQLGIKGQYLSVYCFLFGNEPIHTFMKSGDPWKQHDI